MQKFIIFIFFTKTTSIDNREMEEVTHLVVLLCVIFKQDAFPVFQQLRSQDASCYLTVAHTYLEILQQKSIPKALTGNDAAISVVSGMIDATLEFIGNVPDIYLLQRILKLVEKLATNHFALFKPRFSHMIDVLVGLYLDRASSDSYRNAIAGNFLPSLV